MSLLIRSSLLLLMCLGSVPVVQGAGADPDKVQILMHRVAQTDHEHLVAKNMVLTAQEQELFWPVYRAYVQALEPLNLRAIALAGERGADAQAIGDEQASAYIKEAMSLEAGKMRVKRKYFLQLKALLPAHQVLRFFEIEQARDAVERLERVVDTPLLP